MHIHPTHPALNKPIKQWLIPQELCLYVQISMPVVFVATSSFLWAAKVAAALWVLFFAFTYKDPKWFTLRWRALRRSAVLSPVSAHMKDIRRIMSRA
jgi:type IV secretory pathway VirB3-like protein